MKRSHRKAKNSLSLFSRLFGNFCLSCDTCRNVWSREGLAYYPDPIPISLSAKEDSPNYNYDMLGTLPSRYTHFERVSRKERKGKERKGGKEKKGKGYTWSNDGHIIYIGSYQSIDIYVYLLQCAKACRNRMAPSTGANGETKRISTILGGPFYAFIPPLS